jgi:hypothetical protein
MEARKSTQSFQYEAGIGRPSQSKSRISSRSCATESFISSGVRVCFRRHDRPDPATAAPSPNLFNVRLQGSRLGWVVDSASHYLIPNGGVLTNRVAEKM